MSNNLIFIIVGLAAGVGAVIFIFFPYLKKKGINISSILSELKSFLENTQKYLDAFKALQPENKAISILDTINEYAQIAVKAAEQLYISSQIPADQRKVKALEIVYAKLREIGINTDNENIKTIVSGIIEATVYASKTSDEIDMQLTQVGKTQVEKLQAQINTLTEENARIKAENTALQQKISTIQSTAAAVVQK